MILVVRHANLVAPEGKIVAVSNCKSYRSQKLSCPNKWTSWRSKRWRIFERVLSNKHLNAAKGDT